MCVRSRRAGGRSRRAGGRSRRRQHSAAAAASAARGQLRAARRSEGCAPASAGSRAAGLGRAWRGRWSQRLVARPAPPRLAVERPEAGPPAGVKPRTSAGGGAVRRTPEKEGTALPCAAGRAAVWAGGGVASPTRALMPGREGRAGLRLGPIEVAMIIDSFVSVFLWN